MPPPSLKSPSEILKERFHAELMRSQAQLQTLAKKETKASKHDIFHAMCLYAHMEICPSHKEEEEALEERTFANVKQFESMLSRFRMLSKQRRRQRKTPQQIKQAQLACVNSIALYACKYLEKELKKEVL